MISASVYICTQYWITKIQYHHQLYKSESNKPSYLYLICQFKTHFPIGHSIESARLHTLILIWGANPHTHITYNVSNTNLIWLLPLPPHNMHFPFRKETDGVTVTIMPEIKPSFMGVKHERLLLLLPPRYRYARSIIFCCEVAYN